MLSANQNNREKQLRRNNVRKYFEERIATNSPNKPDHITVAYSLTFYRTVGVRIVALQHQAGRTKLRRIARNSKKCRTFIRLRNNLSGNGYEDQSGERKHGSCESCDPPPSVVVCIPVNIDFAAARRFCGTPISMLWLHVRLGRYRQYSY